MLNFYVSGEGSVEKLNPMHVNGLGLEDKPFQSADELIHPTEMFFGLRMMSLIVWVKATYH